MTPADVLIAFFTSFAGTLGFAIQLQAPKRSWIPVSVLGGLGYLLDVFLLSLGMKLSPAMLVACTVTAYGACILSRHLKMINTVFLTLPIVCFVPGLGLYQCMSFLGSGKNASGLSSGVDAMICILMIVLGLSLGSFLFRLTHISRQKKARDLPPGREKDASKTM